MSFLKAKREPVWVDIKEKSATALMTIADF